jgi:ankyrin repeat-rich membrane spanning protein
MRRLMNVIYIIVRLLKAFQIDFSWYRLSSWINLTEQWPLRASMIVLEHDQGGENLDDNQSLQSVYEKYVNDFSSILLDVFKTFFLKGFVLN